MGNETERPPLEPPLGTYDHLPPQAYERRRVEQRVRALFSLWGYREVITPGFELDEVVRLAGGALLRRQLYRFVDREGQVLALRPDWTPAVARLVAARMREGPLPLRLFYVGNVFRYDRPRPDSPREFTQAGVELIGSDEPVADAEVIALAVQACREAGIDDVRVEVGHAGYVQALLDGLPPAARARARQALMGRDVVAFRQVVQRAEASPEVKRALEELPESRGGLGQVEQAARRCPTQAGREGLAALGRVLRHLEAMGLGEVVAVDLGLVKDLDYYTGPVFEAYAPDAGYSLATGGRYDGLLARFGLLWPATGFAASIDRLVAVARRRVETSAGDAPRVWVVAAGGQAGQAGGDEYLAASRAQQLADALRRLGIAVALDPIRRPLAESLQAARQSGARWAAAPVAGRDDHAAALWLAEPVSGRAIETVEAWPVVPLGRLAQDSDDPRPPDGGHRPL